MRRPPSRLKLVVPAPDAGLSLALFVEKRGGVSAEDARAAILRGGAFVSGARTKKPEGLVRAGDRVEVSLRAPEQPAPTEPKIPLVFVHVDEDLVAVDKPAGVLAQEGRAGGTSLGELVADELWSRGERRFALLIHRLDKGTTGLTVFARSKAAQEFLLEEFRAGRVEKEYLALVSGSPASDRFEIDLPLGPDPAVPGKRRIDAQGETALTRVEVIERFDGAALTVCRPTTGRTHQIRVHLAHAGHPLLGDVRYGGPAQLTRPDGRRLDVLRPLLHAHRLTLRHPGGPKLPLEAPAPADLLAACAFLRLPGAG